MGPRDDRREAEQKKKEPLKVLPPMPMKAKMANISRPTNEKLGSVVAGSRTGSGQQQRPTGSNNKAAGSRSRSTDGGSAEIGMMGRQSGVLPGINQQEHRLPPPPPMLPFSPPPPLAPQQVYSGSGVLRSPPAWTGMKNILDDDIDEVLKRKWSTPIVLVAWSPNRSMGMSGNEALVRACTESDWREFGDVVFFCAGGKTVRCHSVLLQGVLPSFSNHLLEMHRFQFNQYIKGLPFIPVTVMGIEDRVINHLITLVTRGTDILTGGDISMLKIAMKSLNIVEMSICIGPHQMGFAQPRPNFRGGFNFPQAAPSTSGVGSSQPMPRVPPHLDTMANANVQDRQSVQSSVPIGNNTGLRSEAEVEGVEENMPNLEDIITIK